MATINLPVSWLNKITMNAPSELKSKGELVFDSFILAINDHGTFSESNLNLNCKSITIAAFGEYVGVHTIEGLADNLSLTMEGLSFMDVTKMAASKVTMNQRFLKSSYVQALNKPTINMYSSGHVYFSGQPTAEYNAIDPGWNVNFGRAINQSG